jgi:proline iminopeptidase
MPDGKVWYEVYGSGNKTPLLLIHGGPGGIGSCTMSSIKAVSDDRSIIFYDQLGCGRSEITTDTTLWELPNFVRNLDRLIDSLEINKVHLLGHSWGCAIAIEYYLTQKPHKIKSIVLAGPYLSTKLWIQDANYLRSQLPDSIQQILDYHEDRSTIDSEEYLSATYYFISKYNIRTNPCPKFPECSGSIYNKSIYNYMWGPTEFYATGKLIDYDTIDRLEEVDVPVLLIAGEYDEARPETVEQIQKLFPNAKLKVIKDAGHSSYIDKPEEFNIIVRDFIETIE